MNPMNLDKIYVFFFKDHRIIDNPYDLDIVPMNMRDPKIINHGYRIFI